MATPTLVRSAPIAADTTARIPVWLLGIIALMSAVSPLATDMYLAAFPTMAGQFRTEAATIQLTLTTFMIGLAIGQLILGTLSDRFGRRPLLIAGSIALVISSVLCAVAPSIELLIALRFIQGLAGAAGMVIGRAVVADLTSGARAARIFSLLGVVGALSPIAAPILGSLLFTSVGWRGIFWAITLVATILVLAILFLVPESLPVERRHRGGFAEFRRSAGRVVRDRIYVGHTLTLWFGFGAIFAYVSASPFVMQNVLGYSTAGFTAIFAINSFGLMIGSATSAYIVGKVAPIRIVTVGVSALLVSSVLLALVVSTGFARPFTVLPLLFLMVVSISLTGGNGMVLALGRVRHSTGTGSAILGSGQFTIGALVSPIVGLAGEFTAVPMALTIGACGVMAAIGHFVVARPARHPQMTLT